MAFLLSRALVLALAVVLELALPVVLVEPVVLVALFVAPEVVEVAAGVVPEVDGAGELVVGSGVGLGLAGGVEEEEPLPAGDVEPVPEVEVLGEVAVLEGLADVDGDVLTMGTSAGSHCWALLPEAAAVCVTPPLAAGATSAAAATPKLVAETTRKPPAAILIAGRTCARRMKALPLLFVAPDIRVFSTDWRHQVHIASFVRYVRVNIITQL